VFILNYEYNELALVLYREGPSKLTVVAADSNNDGAVCALTLQEDVSSRAYGDNEFEFLNSLEIYNADIYA
jgi:hypothetical protein